LHLDDTSTHEINLGIQICEFIDFLQKFDLNFDFVYFESDYSWDLILD
jgi:hypothetical protein